MSSIPIGVSNWKFPLDESVVNSLSRLNSPIGILRFNMSLWVFMLFLDPVCSCFPGMSPDNAGEAGHAALNAGTLG